MKVSMPPALSHLSAALEPYVRNISRGNFLLGFGLTLLLGGGYMAFASDSSDTTTTASVAQAEVRTITSSVKAVGKVTFSSEQEMRFNQRGTVAKVNVKEGDLVKKGQVIAELDTASVLADIRQAALSVSASALQLQQLQADRDKDIIDAQNALRNTERQYNDAANSLSVTKEKLPSDIKSAENDVIEKKSAVVHAQAELDKAKVTELQSLATTAQSVLTQSENLLDALYGVLVNDASARPLVGNSKTIEIYYRLYNDQSQKNATERSYYAADAAIEMMRANYGGSISALKDTARILSALKEAGTIAGNVRDLADNTYRLLQGAADDAHTLTVSDINSMKSTAVSARTSAITLSTNAETAAASLTGGKNLTSITLQQKEDSLTSAKNSLRQAEDNLKILQTQTPGDMQKQQDVLVKAQEDLASEQAALNSTTKSIDVNIKLKQNDVAQRATSLQKTQKTLEDYKLIAPFDGVVSRLDYKVGDNLLDTGDDKYVVLQNKDFIVVTIPLDQVDIVRIKRDMPASIVFDALPGQRFDGFIDEIDSTPVESSGVVSYNVLVKLPTPKDLTILSGMTATVEVQTAKKENIVAVPNLALARTGGSTTVTLATGETVPVVTGATDGRYTEIVSGLEQGESVVSLNVSGTTGTTGATGASQNQLLRATGGFGAPTGGGVRISR